jgi:hypothetical protein
MEITQTRKHHSIRKGRMHLAAISNALQGWLAPNKAFLYNQEIESKYGNLLDYLKEFSTPAKNFLKSCGCVETPTPNQLAESLIKNYR